MYISLMTNDVKHLFLCLLASGIFFVVKCIINIFSIFNCVFYLPIIEL